MPDPRTQHGPDLGAALHELYGALRRCDEDRTGFVGLVRTIGTIARRHPLPLATDRKAFEQVAVAALQERMQGVDTDRAVKACAWGVLDAAWRRSR